MTPKELEERVEKLETDVNEIKSLKYAGKMLKLICESHETLAGVVLSLFVANEFLNLKGGRVSTGSKRLLCQLPKISYAWSEYNPKEPQTPTNMKDPTD